MACEEGHLAMAELLIRSGADVNAANFVKNGFLIFHL